MQYIQALIVICVQEAVGLIVFLTLNHYLAPEDGKTWDWTAILKGILERLVLFTALIHGYPQMLIAFGAMKLGTRFHTEQGSKISNTCFLVGNLLSMLLAIIGAVVTKAIWQG
jgi:hypothetical protein